MELRAMLVRTVTKTKFGQDGEPESVIQLVLEGPAPDPSDLGKLHALEQLGKELCVGLTLPEGKA